MEGIWGKILEEITNIGDKEPMIKKMIRQNIDKKRGLWHSLSMILSQKLADETCNAAELRNLIAAIFTNFTPLREVILADLQAYLDRDFACENYLEVLLFFRGFQACTAYRIARYLYLNNQRYTAKYFQNRIFEVYGVDIHPQAKLGKGVVIDHGIGLVIGETAEIGDNAYIFHNVTLGGTGHASGDRHPKIKNNVFIGAGATILGNVTINDNANIAAGSVVTKDVPANLTVAGVPAKVIGQAKKLQ